MPRDYIPASDAQFDLWVRNFGEELAERGAELGFSSDEITAFQNAAAHWEVRFEQRLSQRDAARAATAEKRDSRRSLKALIRPYARRVQAHPLTTDAVRAAMGLTPLEQPSPGPSFGIPDDTPLLKLDFGTRGQITVHFGPNPGNENRNPLPPRAIGAVIQMRGVAGSEPPEGGEEDQDQWQWLDNPSSSPYVHVVQPTATRVYAYRVAYLYRRGRKGPWSDPAEAAVTP